jgi:hypothetical protein
MPERSSVTRKVGRYEIIGRGGMAVVYLARHGNRHDAGRGR